MSRLNWKADKVRTFERPYNAATNHERLLEGYDLRGVELARGHGTVLERIILEAKVAPCKDCGGQYKPHQMQFDHLDETKKLFNISQYRVLMPSEETLRAEMGKCEVVCANCHADRTYNRNLQRREERKGRRR